jgi:HSP20 family protein
MTANSATAMERVKETEAVVSKGQETFNQSSETYELISRRAFELFESRGAAPGHEKDDWLRAESELLHPVPLNLIESIGEYVVQAEVPGFHKNDLEIGVEPRRLVISGLRDRGLQRENAQVIYSEVVSNRLLRTVDLPSDVDTSGVRTIVEDGILTVELPKSQDAD